MSDLLQKMLAERPWLLADGATGTNFFAVGLPMGFAPELWNIEEPGKVRDQYRAFIDAGSDIRLDFSVDRVTIGIAASAVANRLAWA